jgi:hypothetical protein
MLTECFLDRCGSRGGRNSRGSGCCDHYLFGFGDQKDGQKECYRTVTAQCRDIGMYQCYLLGQNGNFDYQSDECCTGNNFISES